MLLSLTLKHWLQHKANSSLLTAHSSAAPLNFWKYVTMGKRLYWNLYILLLSGKYKCLKLATQPISESWSVFKPVTWTCLLCWVFFPPQLLSDTPHTTESDWGGGLAGGVMGNNVISSVQQLCWYSAAICVLRAWMSHAVALGEMFSHCHKHTCCHKYPLQW